MSALLAFEQVGVRFGGVIALDSVSFDVQARTICGLIGPNGAGKTTLLNCISRLYPINSGNMLFDGRSLRDTPAHALARLGIARTFQNLALFASMTVRETVLTGLHSSKRSGFVAHALGRASVAREEAQAREQVCELLDSLGLQAIADRPVRDLSLGLRRRVELARALAARPRLLLLDEPSSGLSVEEADALADSILALRDQQDITVLMIEHRMRLIARVCDQVLALNFGRIIARGTSDEVRQHPDVIDAWIGPPR